MEHQTRLSRDAAMVATPASSSGLPTDLLSQSASRLQVLAVMYIVVFLLAGVFPAFLVPADREMFLSSFMHWGPSMIGIIVGSIVALAIRYGTIKAQTAMTLGLVFEVASSYAIAAAEFGNPHQLEMQRGFLGLSWVAVWVVLFTIVVPTSPRRALVAALASVSAVPVVIGIVLASGTVSVSIGPLQFFIGLVFPYLLVVGMAYVGARVVYQLGTEVKRARELGSYHLEDKLGEGGMGEVWRASHRMLARPAAIKLIRPSLGGGHYAGASKDVLDRFEREAQVIAQLRSPHTVHLFDFGIANDGAFYYAMELLDGLDADKVIKQFGAMPPERVIFALRQVCHSLSEAQSCGLVHRDIKPANIFFCRYGEEFDFVKVLDFGIVKAVSEAAETGTVDTSETAVRGTPAFMSPEQAVGGEVDGRGDIYSTGCLAYWLLTGQNVFTADSTMGMLVQHAHTVPVPPSRKARQQIPKAVDEMVMACLEKDPANRPQTAKELARRLGDLPGANAWTQERARAWWDSAFQK